MFAAFPWIEYLYVIAYTEHNSVKDLPMCVLQCLSPASLNKGRHQSKSGKSCEQAKSDRFCDSGEYRVSGDAGEYGVPGHFGEYIDSVNKALI